MLKLKLSTRKDSALNILCLGAHSDDIEIGCGGTIMKLLSENNNVDVNWIVFSAEGKRAKEAGESAEKFLAGARKKKVIVKKFKDGFFPYIGGEIKALFEELKTHVTPDIIFSHYRHDLHQDHRLISELTWNTYRDHLILEYEVLKYDGDIGSPNFFVHLDETTCKKKVEIIRDSFRSQQQRAWFSPDAFYSILRLRGIESRAPDKYAEAFYCRKASL